MDVQEVSAYAACKAALKIVVLMELPLQFNEDFEHANIVNPLKYGCRIQHNPTYKVLPFDEVD